MPPPSSLPTPLAEKPPGLKISLNSGIKRKQSASSTPREGSPKSQKIVKLQTPNGYSSGSPIPRESPATAPAPKVRRGSTPASAAPVIKKSTGRKIVKLRFKKASSASKIASLLSKPPRPRPRPSPSTDQHARSNTPSHVKSSHGNGNGNGTVNGGSSSSSSLISPSSFSASPSQAQALNTGGFRTYAAPAEPVETKTSSSKSFSKGFSEGKYSSHNSSTSHNSSHSHSSSMNKISKSAASSAAPSPTSTSGGSGGGDGMVPPKKKLMLKLGAKKPS
jgi:hypothetical protein